MAERITIQELVVELLFEGSESGVTKFNSALQLFRSLAGAAELAVGSLTRAVVGSTLELADQADALGEMAEQAGLSALVFDALGAKIQKNGGSIEEFSGAVRVLSGNLTDFLKTGQGSGKDAFVAVLGPNARARLAEAGSLDEVLGLLADGLAAIVDPTEQVALANDLLGRSGNKLLPTLKGGAAGLREAITAMQEAGTYSEALLQASSDLGDGVADLGIRWRGLKIIVGEETVPALGELVDELIATFDAARETFGPQIQAGARLLADGFRVLRDLLRALRDGAGDARREVAALNAGLIFLASLGLAAALSALVAIGPWLPFLVGWFIRMGAAAVAAGFRAAAAWVMAAAPLVAMALLITGIILLIEDLITYVQGGSSAFGTLLDKMREGGPVLQSLADLLAYLFGGGLGESTFDAFTRLSEVVRTVFDGIVDGIAAIPGAVADAVAAIGGAVPNVLAGVGQGLAAIPGAFATAGQALTGGGGGTNVTVGGSTVSVAVSGAADPRATGAEVARQVGGVMDSHTTRAARDLAPAFAY